jgi:hypothetical protein
MNFAKSSALSFLDMAACCCCLAAAATAAQPVLPVKAVDRHTKLDYKSAYHEVQ